MTRPTNIRLRFTLLYSAALIATVVLFSAGIYFFVQKMLIGQIDNHLRKDISTIIEYLHNEPDELDKLNKFNLVIYFRIMEHGKPLLLSDQWFEDKLEESIAANTNASSPYSVTTRDKMRFRVCSVNYPENAKGYQITVAHEEDSYRSTLSTLALIIILIMPVSIAISLAAGYLIAGRLLAPISAITERAETITAENLSERLPSDNSNNELNRLALVFNQTFARLENSFERLRRFTADASHELRTPLTAIRSIGETALQQQPEKIDYQETIGSILEETDRLAQTVETLLILSRADSRILEKEPADVGLLLADVVELLGVLAEEKHQKILLELKISLTIVAEQYLLRHAFINLLNNAIKYSPEQGTIVISLYTNLQGEICLDFIDNGPGIPDREKELVFNRFYRPDSGRSRQNGGTGLGLAITKAAVEAHNGTITLLDNQSGGSIFRITFPNS